MFARYNWKSEGGIYEINTKVINEEDNVSLTDIAKKVNGNEPRFVIQNWMRNKDTLII